jgi:hypothetical protein
MHAALLHLYLRFILATALSMSAWTALAAAPLPASAQVLQGFERPPREFATAPLWVWNDLLTEQQIRDTMRDLAGQDVRQVFVHPRPGLMTPYLDQDWFRLWRTALDEAKKLDMNVWIYDENSYPSGFAGGWVPELMPESRGRGLHFQETTSPPTASPEVLAVYRLGGSAPENVTAQWRSGAGLPEGHPYLVATIKRAGNSPWHGGRSYVDLLFPGVTEKFIEVTLEKYRREIGDEFGKRIPGVFTDEPELVPAGGLPWTPDLPEQFQRRWGYDLIASLPSLKLPTGDWKRVRHNYYQTLLDLFIERWAKPYYDWCERHNLEFTGHYWEHEWPNCVGVPDNMAMSAWQQRPGIDTLMNQYAEHTHAQFGNIRAVREIASVANQLGRRRTLCEAYGAGGWDLRFEDMKRIGDWLYVLGVNTLDEHLSYVTLRGARKRDHPQSFSYHEPWWGAYHNVATYFGRLSAILSQGQQINRLLVLEPTTTAWCYQGDREHLGKIGESFAQLAKELDTAQIEYDLGCEDIVARHGRVQGAEFVIGQRSYPVIVLPPFTENLNGRTWTLLHEFIVNGGRILNCGAKPQFIDGRWASGSQEDGPAAKFNPRWESVDRSDLVARVEALNLTPGFAIRREAGDRGILFHHRRQLADGQILFLVNTSLDQVSDGSVQAANRSVERWDPHTGAAEDYPFTRTGEGLEISFRLPPAGSLLLFLSDQADAARSTGRSPSGLTTAGSASVSGQAGAIAVTPKESMTIRRLAPNVLTLDHVDVKAAGETRTNLYYYPAQQWVFQKHGLERNPWDSAVQFQDEFIRKSFPPDSGFEVSYRFRLEGAAPHDLGIAVERPDLYSVTCNDQAVRAVPGDYWRDKAFGRIDLSKVAKPGENVVTLKARPFTIFHEIEPAYLLGDFSVEPAERGFVVKPPTPLTLKPWKEQGLSFYADGVAYRQSFELPSIDGRYAVACPRWHGAVIEVRINGKSAGHIGWAPWSLDVTRWLKQGANEVEVVVIGTLKNTFGPHHGKPGLGSAWPGMFQKAPEVALPPGRDYHTVDYGLWEPFSLERWTP